MRRSAIPTILCLLFASWRVEAATNLEPGLYEVTTTDGQSKQRETTRECVTAADIARSLSPDGVDQSCKIRSGMADGRMDFTATCAESTTSMKGTYTATGYVFDSQVHIRAKDGTKVDLAQHHVGRKVANSCTKS